MMGVDEITKLVRELRELQEAYAERVQRERQLHSEWTEAQSESDKLGKQIKELSSRIQDAL